MSQSRTTLPTGLNCGCWSHVSFQVLGFEDDSQILLLRVKLSRLLLGKAEIQCINKSPAPIAVPQNNGALRCGCSSVTQGVLSRPEALNSAQDPASKQTSKVYLLFM